MQSFAESARQEIRSVFQNAGVAPERIEFVPRKLRVDYLRLYDSIDIGLDPLPYNGITTTCDALWMGVPVVTLVGKTAAGRAGVSILSTVGLPEMIAHTEEQFIEIAVKLANDAPRLAELRTTLRDRTEKSPLMDAPGFARKWKPPIATCGGNGVNATMADEITAQQAMNEALDLQRHGRLDEAEDAYRRLLSLHPHRAAVLNNLANVLKDSGRIEEAVETCRSAWCWSRTTRRSTAAFATRSSFIPITIAPEFFENNASGIAGMVELHLYQPGAGSSPGGRLRHRLRFPGLLRPRRMFLRDSPAQIA